VLRNVEYILHKPGWFPGANIVLEHEENLDGARARILRLLLRCDVKEVPPTGAFMHKLNAKTDATLLKTTCADMWYMTFNALPAHNTHEVMLKAQTLIALMWKYDARAVQQRINMHNKLAIWWFNDLFKVARELYPRFLSSFGISMCFSHANAPGEAQKRPSVPVSWCCETAV
jgi:hypothetical protein